MIKLNQNYEVDRSILKCVYIRYSISEMSTTIDANSEKSINIPREVSIISLLNSYLDLYIDVFHAVTGNNYADGYDSRLIISIQLFF